MAEWVAFMKARTVPFTAGKSSKVDDICRGGKNPAVLVRMRRFDEENQRAPCETAHKTGARHEAFKPAA